MNHWIHTILALVVGAAVLCLPTGPAHAGCSITIKGKNANNSDVLNVDDDSKVKAKGGSWVPLWKENGRGRCPGQHPELATGQKFTAACTLTESCKRYRRYKFHVCIRGGGCAWKEYPSSDSKRYTKSRVINLGDLGRLFSSLTPGPPPGSSPADEHDAALANSAAPTGPVAVSRPCGFAWRRESGPAGSGAEGMTWGC